MFVVNSLRGIVVDSSIKDHIKSKIGSIKSALGIKSDAEGQYGQMQFDEENVELDADGMPRAQKKKVYKEGSFRNRVSKRYFLAWMSNLGFIILFAMRCNLSVAMTGMNKFNIMEENYESEMANQTYAQQDITEKSSTSNHPFRNNKMNNKNSDLVKHLTRTRRSIHEPKILESIANKLHINRHLKIDTEGLPIWESSVRAGVDSSFFYGYLITQIPGGIIASKFPANKIFGLAIVSSSILNLLLPTMVKTHYMGVIFLRVLQGLVEGTTYPACHGIWRHWAPPLERTRLATISLCGSYAGAVFGLSISGWLATFGWVIPFYASSVIGILWFLAWWFTTFESPAKHPYISAEELEYIESSIGVGKNVVEKKVAVPWKAFFTSMPVYAIIVANIARSWSFYLLIMKTLKYFSEVHKSSLAESGLESSTPHLIMAIIVPIGGQMADRLRKKRMSTTNVRKIFNCGGFGMEALFLYFLAASGGKFSAIVCMNLAVGFSGFAISGYNVNHLDIAPRFASILMGLSNGMGTISGMVCPSVTEIITKDHTKASWSKVFIIAGTVHLVGVIFYAIFASGEKQPWADPPEELESTVTSQDNQQKYIVSDPSNYSNTNENQPNVDYGYQDANYDNSMNSTYQTQDPFAEQQYPASTPNQNQSYQQQQTRSSQNYHYGY